MSDWVVQDIPEDAEVYCIDIDGTLGTETNGRPLEAEPIKERIHIINNLYDKGATIYLMTARGMNASNNNQVEADKLFREVTEKQLKEWGVSYTALFFGKPRANYYIDDKGWNDRDFFRQF
jgi:ribonucleotide monophosphatase NagD (HAD superfamily)